MVNIIVAHMREKEGRFVSKTTKEFHALGIVSLFPSLKDPYSKKGYEHFYDIQSNKGFLEWRVKTVQRQSRTTSTSHNRVELKGGPTSSRTLCSIDQSSATSTSYLPVLENASDSLPVIPDPLDYFCVLQPRTSRIIQLLPSLFGYWGNTHTQTLGTPVPP
ncbi:hypothetical protein AALO_G00221540 [Alosa alosa]|uniref:Uncharacterized protein n=1 Tax=Alosa alosa TaxID=278164 RepID=A0AAV6FX75_9TELE|nr:hypothetical protein AALO_G00221540 [Alosa alosa]